MNHVTGERVKVPSCSVGYRIGVCYHGDGTYSIVGDLQHYEVSLKKVSSTTTM